MATRTSIKRRLLLFSLILFLAIFTVGGAAFVLSRWQIAHVNAGHELIQAVEIERIKLEESVNSEIIIALKMADSPLIKRHFLNPGDEEIKTITFSSSSPGLRKWRFINGESAILRAIAISLFTDASSLIRSVSTAFASSCPAFKWAICHLERTKAVLLPIKIAKKNTIEKSSNRRFIEVRVAIIHPPCLTQKSDCVQIFKTAYPLFQKCLLYGRFDRNKKSIFFC